MSEQNEKNSEDANASTVDAIVSFTEWNNGEVEREDEYYEPIYAKKLVVSTGEEMPTGQVIGYCGVKSGIRLGFWATLIME